MEKQNGRGPRHSTEAPFSRTSSNGQSSTVCVYVCTFFLVAVYAACRRMWPVIGLFNFSRHPCCACLLSPAVSTNYLATESPPAKYSVLVLVYSSPRGRCQWQTAIHVGHTSCRILYSLLLCISDRLRGNNTLDRISIVFCIVLWYVLSLKLILRRKGLWEIVDGVFLLTGFPAMHQAATR